jgi:hypothetical protein
MQDNNNNNNNNNNNDINDNRVRALGNADRRQAARNAEATTRARRLNKTQYFDGILPHHEQYTMKRSFNAYVKKRYCNTLFQNVKRASQQITNLAYRLQLFLLDYTLHYPDDVPPALLSTNGLYSLTQLIRGLPLTSTNTDFPKNQVLEHWDRMIITHPDLTTTYDMNTKILSDYCQRQSTCNNLHLSGNFPKRIKSFCRFRFNQLLDEVCPFILTVCSSPLLISFL